uniref:Uncharacterized protein n=1 Tax=Plectus sambesii TaxID=2011161 RepID=A0A914V489_9BILA
MARPSAAACTVDEHHRRPRSLDRVRHHVRRGNGEMGCSYERIRNDRRGHAAGARPPLAETRARSLALLLKEVAQGIVNDLLNPYNVSMLVALSYCSARTAIQREWRPANLE